MTPTVVRPRFASAGRPFWILAGIYLALLAVLCASLATWALGWPVALGMYVVLVAMLAVMFWATLRAACFSIDADTVAYQASAWGPQKVLHRAHLVRVLTIGRVKSSLPIGALMILAADGTRIGASRWLWSSDDFRAVTTAIGLPVEHRETVGSLDLIREVGVDPAYKRNPVHVLVLLAAAAVGVLIAWPIVRALLL
ncbi:hypothetical protein ACFPJ1_25110 [Kribbella qitaiheensis]|uniref:hypothetical protein n=1 Tax=Kribbella qitaiheensis TaxID=1544730 RepID=UPI003616FD3F